MDLVTDYKINSHFSWVDMRLCFVNYLNIWAISFIKNSQNVCKFLESQSSEAVKSHEDWYSKELWSAEALIVHWHLN